MIIFGSLGVCGLPLYVSVFEIERPRDERVCKANKRRRMSSNQILGLLLSTVFALRSLDFSKELIEPNSADRP